VLLLLLLGVLPLQQPFPQHAERRYAVVGLSRHCCRVRVCVGVGVNVGIVLVVSVG
jgi:hypothetical protein